MVIKTYIFIILMLVTGGVQAAQVIANESVQVDELSHSQLRRIYSMRQTVWPDGTAISVFVLPNSHDLHLQFCKQKLKMFPYQLDAIWDKLTYSGVGYRPKEVTDINELIEKVRTTPNSIGYIEKVDDLQSIKVINIVK